MTSSASITFNNDHLNVVSKYTTHIEAVKGKYPVLLSSGDSINSGHFDVRN